MHMREVSQEKSLIFFNYSCCTALGPPAMSTPKWPFLIWTVRKRANAVLRCTVDLLKAVTVKNKTLKVRKSSWKIAEPKALDLHFELCTQVLLLPFEPQKVL